jgi:uncharacterized protein YigE (DUF2233 family)
MRVVHARIPRAAHAARCRRGILAIALAWECLSLTAFRAGAGELEFAPGTWRALEPGLELAAFEAPMKAELGDSLVRVLRIDPGRFALRLLNASAPGQGNRLTARQWCRKNGLVAAMNASMYQQDYKTSVSLMTTKEHTNNPRLSRDRAVLAFDRLDDTVPPVQILDREQQSFDELRGRYATLVQSIRMVSLSGKNVWQPQERKWSTAAVGMDRQGRVLFIHVRSPYRTHDLINILLALPIDLRNAMYAEGGSEAQLYVRSGDTELEFVGMYDHGLVDTAPAAIAWPVPNVIGVARIDEPGS